MPLLPLTFLLFVILIGALTLTFVALLVAISSARWESISWKSKKQPFVSLSSVEAEYCSMRQVVAELTLLVCLLSDLSISPSLLVPLFSDSQAVIHIAKKTIFHERTKNVELDCHFVR